MNQNGSVSGKGTFNNNAGAELNINAATTLKFVNEGKTTKAAAAVINVAEGAKLTTSAASENKGIINVDGTLDASNLTQTEADARIVIGEKA